MKTFRKLFINFNPFRSITRACNNLARPDKLVSDAVDVRSELDLRIGTTFAIHYPFLCLFRYRFRMNESFLM